MYSAKLLSSYLLSPCFFLLPTRYLITRLPVDFGDRRLKDHFLLNQTLFRELQYLDHRSLSPTSRQMGYFQQSTSISLSAGASKGLILFFQIMRLSWSFSNTCLRPSLCITDMTLVTTVKVSLPRSTPQADANLHTRYTACT